MRAQGKAFFLLLWLVWFTGVTTGADTAGKPCGFTCTYLCEQPPRYPGGEQALYDFLACNLQWPPGERDATVNGRVLLGFTVTETGAVSDIKVLKGSLPIAFNREAVRVIALMPDWTPGIFCGKPTPVKMAIPVSFVVK